MTAQVNPPATDLPAPPQETTSRLRAWGRRLVGVAVIIVLGFYAVLGVGAAFLAVRLQQGPLDLGFALPVVEKIMSRSERLQFRIGTLTLAWQGRKNPLALEMNNVRLMGPRGEFLTIGRTDLGLSAWRLFLGQLQFSYAEVQNLSMRIIRLPDGSITLTGVDVEDKEARSVKLELTNVVNDLPAIDNLKLSHMRVIFEDQKEALVRRFEDVNMEIQQTNGLGGRSLSGYLTSSLDGTTDGALATVDFIYEAGDQMLTAMARLDKTDTRQMIGGILRAANLPLIDMMVQGRAEIRLRNDFALDNLMLQLSGDDGMLYWPRNYGEGLENQKLTKFDLHVGFAPETNTLKLLNAEITIKGITLQLAGDLTADAQWRRLQGNVGLKIPVIAVDAVPAVWPAVWKSGGRNWLVDRMDKGRFANIAVNVPLTALRETLAPDDDDIEIALDTPEAEPEGDTTWKIDTGTIKGTFDFTGVTVDYRAPLLPAQNTTGTGVYEGLGLTLDIDKAQIGGMAVTDGRLYFDDLVTPGTGHANLHFNMNGTIASVFSYLEREPIAYKKKVSLDASQSKGNAALDLTVDFPTHHDMSVDEVRVKALAKLTDLSFPGAVKGLTLAGPSFTLEASEKHFRIDGSGTLEGQPATIDWQEYFSPRPGDVFGAKLSAKIQTNKTIRQNFIGSLEERIDGIIPADITMVTSPSGKSDLAVTAVLNDAAVDFTNPFNTIKEKGQPATARLTATLQDNNIQSIDTLNVTGAGMSLSSGSITFARNAAQEPVLASANLENLRLGLNDTSIDAKWASENDIKASISGNAFDARNILGSKVPANRAAASAPAKTAMAYDATLKLERLYLSDSPLEKASGSFRGNTGGTIQLAQLDGTAGGAPVVLRYNGTGASDARLLLEAGNAGAGLAALGISERVRGGNIRIAASPYAGTNAGDMKGKLVISDFSVAKAPVLAKLINLLSVPGLLNILNQDTGLTFGRAESDITWVNKPGGPSLYFADGRTSGSSLGLTFEGEVDMAADTIDINGTVVPMSEVNSLVSKIPLVGDILTGGSKGGGIFAATYKLSGPGASPDVSINPLSVLTPGILRRILFEGSAAKPDKPQPSQP